MKRSFFGLLLVIAAAMALLLSPLPSTASGSPQNERVSGKVRPDAALVYIYRESNILNRIFCDDQLVGDLKEKSYTFAYISPGTHIFWDAYRMLGVCDFAAGQTYYLSMEFTGLSVLSETDGVAIVRKAKRYEELTQEQRTKAAKILLEKWPKHQDELRVRLELAGGEVVFTPPVSTENMVKIPGGTALKAELMENLNSRLNNVGDIVWVRATEDIQIDGNLFVRADTPIKALVRDAKKHGFGDSPGYLDLTIVSVDMADGTVCPLFGQVATTGARLSQAPATAAFLVGGFPGAIALAAIRGARESFHAAGEVVTIFTRQDVWIKPIQVTNETSPGERKLSDTVRAYARSKIACNLVKGEVPQIAEIIFDSASDLTNAELVQVNGKQIPMPIRARNFSRVKEGWAAQFGGWDLCRFLRPTDTGTQLTFGLSAADGTVKIAQGTLSIILK